MLSDNIKTVRKNRGFTQEELASRLHVTRQTVSKWEKGYSVPDAELLSRMAEVFEVPVSDLLGAPSQPPADMEPIVEQLSRLNEQLAIRNRRSARMWKIVGIVLAALILIPVILSVLLVSVEKSGAEPIAGHIEWVCALDGEEHFYSVSYQRNYCIVGRAEDVFFEERGVGLDHIDDARELEDELHRWFEERGGSVEVFSQDGLTLE